MRTSFVGLINRYGLESLLPENAATRRWALDTARRRRTSCVWAVLPADDADEIVELLTAGDGWRALQRMAQLAHSVGPLLQ